MELEAVLSVVLRWMHIFGAAIAIGGAALMRLALQPAAAALNNDARATLHEGIARRWSLYVRIAITFLSVSGIYNVVAKMSTAPVLYHILFTFKLLFALGVFFIASALVGRSPALAGFREQRKKWLTINLALVLGVMLISGVLRQLPSKAANTPKAAQSDSAAKQ